MTVTGYVPVGVVGEVERVKVELHGGLQAPGLKVAVAPDGRPAADKLTAWEVPAVRVVDTVAVADCPATTLDEDGVT